MSKLKLPPPPFPLHWKPARTYAEKVKFRVNDLRKDSSSVGAAETSFPSASVRTRVFKIEPESAFDSKTFISASIELIRSSYCFCIFWTCESYSDCIFCIWVFKAETSLLLLLVSWARQTDPVHKKATASFAHRAPVGGLNFMLY